MPNRERPAIESTISRAQANEAGLARPTIVVIEPHPGIATLLERIFSGRGWATNLCDRPEGALTYAQRYPPEAVLWDYSPRLTTTDSLREFRDALCPTPLVLTSAWDEARTVAAQMELLILRQPFSLEDVESTMRTAIARGS